MFHSFLCGYDQKLVVLDPKGRISAKAALYHRYFNDLDKQRFLQ